jgi:hypothetical protein
MKPTRNTAKEAFFLAHGRAPFQGSRRVPEI